MSDYEGDDWQLVRSSKQRPRPQSRSLAMRPSLTEHVSNNTRIRSTLSKNAGSPKRRICRDDVSHETHQTERGRHFEHMSDSQACEPAAATTTNMSASQRRSQLLPDTPDREYIMSCSWQELLKRISNSRQTALMTVQQQIDSICMSSDAYIRTPNNNTNVIYIWGGKDQCELAVAQLDAWQMNFGTRDRKSKDVIWTRSRAYDGRKEHRSMQESYALHTQQYFRDVDDSGFGFEAYLIWPSTYDLEAYLKLFESVALEDISINFKCHFHHEKRKQPRYTRIRAETEQDLLAVYQRLIGMAREMLMKKKPGIHGNFFLIPSRRTSADTVAVERDSSNRTFSFMLNENDESESIVKEWHKLVQQADSRVRKAICNTLSMFIQNLHVSESHIRMRANFGHLQLQSYQSPPDGSNIFRIDDFFRMVENPRTNLTDCALEAKDKSMFHLIKTLDQMSEFYQPEEVFKIMYDFQSFGKSSSVRLETERVRGYAAGETQLRAQRWLALDARIENDTILNLNVVDLQDPCFTLCVKRYDLLCDSNITKEMSAFQNAHDFMPDLHGDQSFPRRRSVIPPGQKDLTTVKEVTSVKMRVRDMDGIFEIQREDIYDHRNGKDSPWPILSRWYASYYYLGWDNRLDELGNIKPGEDVSWDKVLSSFFSEDATERETLSLAPGFKKFWEEIKLIQGYLSEAISRIASVQPEKVVT